MRSKNSSSGQATSFIQNARRSQFIDCAINSLAERGFARTSIAEVAARAEVSKSVVLYHFSSSSALMEAVVEQVYRAAGPAVVAAIQAATDDRGRLAGYLRACVDFAWTQQRQTRALGEIFRNLRRKDGTLRYTAEDSNELIDAVQQLLIAGQRSGQFRSFDSRTMAVVIRSVIDSLPETFRSETFRSGATPDGPAFADELVQLFDAATRSEPPEPDVRP